MKFKDIPGNARIKEALTGLADADRIPHAIMLCGPSGIGKMLMARTFVSYVHCSERSGGEPCGRCQACLQHASFNHPDTHFIFPIVKSVTAKRLVSKDEIDHWRQMLTDFPAMPPEKWLELIEAGNSQPAIYVDEAEQIIRQEAYAAYSSKYKFFIIWLPERMRPEAANKLLKVIEEPSPGTVFILVSNEDSKVLPTISSRTQRFNMSTLSREEITDYLQSRYSLRDYEAFELAKLAEGRLSKADELGANSGETQEFDEIFRGVMRAAYARKLVVLRDYADQTAAFGREKLRRFLVYLGRMTRENFIYNLKMPELSALSRTEEEFSRKFSPFINHSNVEGIISEIGRAENDIMRNANAKLVMYDFFLLLTALILKKTQN